MAGSPNQFDDERNELASARIATKYGRQDNHDSQVMLLDTQGTERVKLTTGSANDVCTNDTGREC